MVCLHTDDRIDGDGGVAVSSAGWVVCLHTEGFGGSDEW